VGLGVAAGVNAGGAVGGIGVTVGRVMICPQALSQTKSEKATMTAAFAVCVAGQSLLSDAML
jgi:hypothetical protein